MLSIPDAFGFDYFGTDVAYGRGAIDRLGELLARRDLSNAFVVCGSNVGANDDVMGPVRRGLGDRLAGVFDETTPEKSAATVADGIAAMREVEADVLVGVGGGSSLDVARQMSAFAADGRDVSAFRETVRDGREAAPEPEEPLTPVVVVPTTFAGAGIASGGSVELLSADESPTGQPATASGSVTPVAAVYDPDLFETTPAGALAGSAMNGFDKGIETIYSTDPTPITDATAVRGLRLLGEALPELSGDDPSAMDRAVTGLLLVQFDRRTSIVHAFGHGFARRYPVQQGVIHAVVVPHVLRYVFDEVDARRDVLAEGLGVDEGLSGGDLAAAVVDEVVAVRDGLDLPTRLRDVDPVAEADFQAIASFVRDDHAMARAPDGLDPSAAEIEAVLRDAW